MLISTNNLFCWNNFEFLFFWQSQEIDADITKEYARQKDYLEKYRQNKHVFVTTHKICHVFVQTFVSHIPTICLVLICFRFCWLFIVISLFSRPDYSEIPILRLKFFKSVLLNLLTDSHLSPMFLLNHRLFKLYWQSYWQTFLKIKFLWLHNTNQTLITNDTILWFSPDNKTNFSKIYFNTMNNH